MDIAKFNQVLKTKVALAKGFEIRSEIDSAVKLWLDISEMTLNFSKSRKISTHYKNMLIERTTSIIKHIKDLKAGQIEKVIFDEEVLIQKEQPQEYTTSERDLDEPKDVEPLENKPFEENTKSNVLEQSEFNNLPQGFKELQISETFKIVTPHDGKYVEKILNREKSLNGEIKKNFEQAPTAEEERFDFDQPVESKTLICFACGNSNEKSAKICTSCGTELN
ncbi:hypothetical protein LCGC14_0658340 [marine sediment metagenome]|uniref:Zinc-ribbon domain-containing protein n=1 Tax=marine sediment metagenome TaxID=412755 RepID=A0A0F9TG08_9ZZZZ|nr:MAG: hypothetical protein Lokiarch_37900 [Candidatus Lokiarchaeum sp. GC14_75]HEC36772.1 zinc ribbon domain-containing protein [bacterium]